MSRRVTIEWTDETARVWWRFGSGRTGRFPGRARAFVMMLREWVFNHYARPVMTGGEPASPFARALAALPTLRLIPALAIPRVFTPAHIRTTVHAIAPPALRRPTVGRTALTP